METSETKETMAEQPLEQKTPKKKKKGKGVLWAIVAVILLLGVGGSTALSAFTLFTLKDFIVSQEEEENPETTEDYVTIAEQYEILPTTEISDAYKSGDTSELTDKQKETLDMASAALQEMNITDGGSNPFLQDCAYSADVSFGKQYPPYPHPG